MHSAQTVCMLHQFLFCSQTIGSVFFSFATLGVATIWECGSDSVIFSWLSYNSSMNLLAVRMRACTRTPANALLFCRHFNISLCVCVCCCFFRLFHLVVWFASGVYLLKCTHVLPTWKSELVRCVCQLIAIFSYRIWVFCQLLQTNMHIQHRCVWLYFNSHFQFVYLFIRCIPLYPQRSSFPTLNHHISIALHFQIISGKTCSGWNWKKNCGNCGDSGSTGSCSNRPHILTRCIAYTIVTATHFEQSKISILRCLICISLLIFCSAFST